MTGLLTKGNMDIETRHFWNLANIMLDLLALGGYKNNLYS